MKVLVSMILALGVLAVAVTYMGSSDDVEVLQRLGLPSVAPKTTPNSAAPRGATQTVDGAMYRWRDANGTLHLESSPPRDGSAFETITYTKQVVIESSETARVDSQTTGATPKAKPVNPLKVYTPEGMEQLMQQVEKTGKQLQERDRLMETLSDDL